MTLHHVAAETYQPATDADGGRNVDILPRDVLPSIGRIRYIRKRTVGSEVTYFSQRDR